MRVLMVSRTYTHPHDMGNRKRVYNECKKMKELGWQIDFLYIGSRLACDISAMQDFFGKDHLFFAEWNEIKLKYELKKEWRNKLDRCGITKYLSVPYDADEWYSDSLEDGLALLCKKRGKKFEEIDQLYDAVWVQYFFYSKFLELLPKKILKIIDTIDRFSFRNRMYQKDGRIPDFYYTIPKEERKALSRADVAISIQNQEEEWFNKLLKGTNTQVITMGDVVELNPASFYPQKCYGFIGADNKPNELALDWFIKMVLPYVKGQEPESEFVIAGGICKKIKDSTLYKKLGRVENLNDFYGNIRCAVNPILHGTGLNIKGIETLSYCKPLVSTSVGAKGLKAAKDAMFVADSPKEFAEAILTVLREESMCKGMSLAAEKFIIDYNKENESVLMRIEELVNKKKKCT